MLTSFMTSVLPQRFLYPQRRRFRDRPAASIKSGSPLVRLLCFAGGGILLASVVLLISAALLTPSEQTSFDAGANSDQDHAASAISATDGRAIPDFHDALPVEKLPDPVATRIDQACAAHAREKLTAGLTNYYLQRRLRPGASSEDAADSSSVTGILAGPGDPAAVTPESSCRG